MEKWDLFDDDRKSLGKIHFRKDKIPEGRYHIVVDVWTVDKNNNILLTLRHPDKDKYPNFWENTGGSVLSGEKSKEGAVRELFEETGLVVDESELSLLGTKKEDTAFVDTYIVRKIQGSFSLRMQEGETIAAKWVTIERLDEMIENKEIASPVVERLANVRDKFENFLWG